jgi:hypothetical protein
MKKREDTPASRVVEAPPRRLFLPLNDDDVVVVVRRPSPSSIAVGGSIVVVLEVLGRGNWSLTPPSSKRHGHWATAGDDGVVLVLVVVVVVSKGECGQCTLTKPKNRLEPVETGQSRVPKFGQPATGYCQMHSDRNRWSGCDRLRSGPVLVFFRLQQLNLGTLFV